jgi:hypothetical protein
MDAARLEKREAWSAPARRKIAPTSKAMFICKIVGWRLHNDAKADT